jgi:hypothetical protein
VAESANPEYVPVQEAVTMFWEEVSGMDPADICARTGAERITDTALSVTCLGEAWRVDLDAKAIGPAACMPARKCDMMAPFLIITYLARCGAVEPCGDMIAPRDMIPGNDFFQGEHTLYTHELEARFGADADAFVDARRALGGTSAGHGDASAVFRILPKVRAEVILHLADDEFPADVRLLIDRNMRRIYPVDATYGALAWLINRLLFEARAE